MVLWILGVRACKRGSVLGIDRMIIDENRGECEIGGTK